MIRIHPARLEDAPALKKLNDLFNGENSNSLEAIQSSLLHNNQEYVCVTEIDGQIVGFCCAQIFKSFCYDENYGEITELFVLENYRRRGAASGMIALMEETFREQGIRHFQLFTGGDNETAKAFYKRQGYRETTEMMFRKKSSL